MNNRYNIHRKGFAQGMGWLPASAEMMRHGFRPLLAIAALWLGVSLIVVIPLIGQVVLALLTPLLTAGVLLAFDRLGQRRVPEPTILFAAWRDPVRRGGLLMLGVVGMAGGLAAALILASWLGAQLGEEQLEAALQSPEALAEALTGVSLAGGFLVAGAVLGLVLASLYFAIPLIMFGRAPTLTALVTSIKAVVINWLAFVGYLIALLAIVFGLVIVVVLVTSFLTLALGQIGAFIAQILLLIVAMLFQVLLGGAQYLAFSQIFGWSPGLEEEDSGDDDNVVI